MKTAKVETFRTTFIRDKNAQGNFRYVRNRTEKYEKKGECVNVRTVHTKHKETPSGERYTIEQTATASRADVLALWVASFPLARGTLSADGLTFTTKVEI